MALLKSACLKCNAAPNNLAAEYFIPAGGPVIAWGIYEASSTPFRELFTAIHPDQYEALLDLMRAVCVSLVRVSAQIKGRFVRAAKCQAPQTLLILLLSSSPACKFSKPSCACLWKCARCERSIL